MSNYITIESGYFKPFKENETDPELKIWADKYFEIIKRIHEALLPYIESIKSNDYESERSFKKNLSELEEELRECLLHRSWVGQKSLLINESNIVGVEYVVERVHNTTFHTYRFGTGVVEDYNDYNMYDSGTRDRLEFRTGVWTIRVLELDRSGLFQEVQFFINQIKQNEDMQYLLAEFVNIFTRCSIDETYKNFQSNNIDKIKKDRIKCGSFETIDLY